MQSSWWNVSIIKKTISFIYLIIRNIFEFHYKFYYSLGYYFNYNKYNIL